MFVCSILSCHYAALRREYFHLLHKSLLDIERLIRSFPHPRQGLCSVGWNKSNTFNLSSPDSFSKPLSSWWHSAKLSPAFQYLCWTREHTVFQLWPNKCQIGWNKHIPQSAGSCWCITLVDAAQDPPCPHCCQGTLQTHTLLAVHWDGPPAPSQPTYTPAKWIPACFTVAWV